MSLEPSALRDITYTTGTAAGSRGEQYIFRRSYKLHNGIQGRGVMPQTVSHCTTPDIVIAYSFRHLIWALAGFWWGFQRIPISRWTWFVAMSLSSLLSKINAGMPYVLTLKRFFAFQAGKIHLQQGHQEHQRWFRSITTASTSFSEVYFSCRAPKPSTHIKQPRLRPLRTSEEASKSSPRAIWSPSLTRYAQMTLSIPCHTDMLLFLCQIMSTAVHHTDQK